MPALSRIGTPFIELLTVQSTNNYAMALAREGMAQHGAVVFAHDQKKGKGQRNKEWTSQKNMNIALSAVVDPQTCRSHIFLLSIMVAVAVREMVAEYAGDNVKIKWPNDVYWCDRKAAGILIENLWQGNQWKFAIAGIGVNVNQTLFGELNHRAVSLKQITGKNLEPLALAKQLCVVLQKKYQLLLHSPASLIDEYKTYLYKLNETVKLKKENRIFEATIKNVSADGELIVQHVMEERFKVGEVEWVI